MLQISDRTDFATRLAYFMSAQQNLAKSGIQPTGESLQASTLEFLDQFDKPTPPPFEPATGQVVGHVIRRKGDKKLMYFAGRPFHDGVWTASAHLNNHVPSKLDREEYEIVPVRTAD